MAETITTHEAMSTDRRVRRLLPSDYARLEAAGRAFLAAHPEVRTEDCEKWIAQEGWSDAGHEPLDPMPTATWVEMRVRQGKLGQDLLGLWRADVRGALGDGNCWSYGTVIER